MNKIFLYGLMFLLIISVLVIYPALGLKVPATSGFTGETAAMGEGVSTGAPAPNLDRTPQYPQYPPSTSPSITASPGGTASPSGSPGLSGSIIQVPIDSTGNQVNPTYIINGVNYAHVGVLYAQSPDSPTGIAGTNLPQAVNVDLAQLGLEHVNTVYMETQNAWAFDLPNGVKVATLVFDYADGGMPTTLDLIMGSNTAEWAHDNPDMAIAYGSSPHSMPPIIFSAPTTEASNQEYQAHDYAASVSLDPTRTLSKISLELTDASQLVGYRNPRGAHPTWLSQAIISITLEGPSSAAMIPGSTTTSLGTTVTSLGNQGSLNPWGIPITEKELTSITWQFGRGDKSVIGNNMHLDPGGKIPSQSLNENHWAVEGSELLFYDVHNKIATRFNTFAKDENGKWVISGPFVLTTEGVIHVLKQLS